MSRPRAPQQCTKCGAKGPTTRGLCRSVCYEVDRRARAGRTPRSEAPPMVPLPGLRVPVHVAACLATSAKRRGVTGAQVQREILEAWADGR